MNKIQDEHLKEFRRIADAATQSEWSWGSHSEFDLKKSLRWIGKMLQHHPRNHELFLVLQGGVDGAPAIALTGNGDNSQNNAIYLAMVQPKNVTVLLDALTASYRRDEALEFTLNETVKALYILLKSRDCLAPDNSPEIPEQISAAFDIGLDDAQFISELVLP